MERCQDTIHRVAGQLVKDKKRKMEEVLSEGKSYEGKDLLSLLCKFHSHDLRMYSNFTAVKSNASNELAPENRISDEDILHNINTFMFAGSDTSSLSLAWTFYLLANHPDIQSRLRNELLSISPATGASDLTEEEILSLYDNLSNLPYLHNVVRESLRLIPPVHSSIRVATKDDEVPTMYPVHGRDGQVISGKRSVTVPKGSFVHVAVEGFNLDKEMWGEDAWDFKFVFRSISVMAGF